MNMHTLCNSQRRIPRVFSLDHFFMQDMVAFSCCIYDGGDKEKIDMDAARERGWRGKFTKRGKVIDPGAFRINGKCPLTPLEVLFFLSCQLDIQ